jgi:site-specific DNA-methyltransferase (adenine-specific)/modification methylase
MKEKILLNHIYNESCLDTLSKMSDNSIGVVITSPPYNMNLRISKGKYTVLCH